MFHQNAVANGGKPSLFGAVFQLLEMGSVLRIFGTKQNNQKGYVLTKDEVKSIWYNNEYPSPECPYNSNKKPYSTFETVGNHTVMIYYFAKAWAIQKLSD